MNISSTQKKHFRKIGHQLKPIIMIGDKGLSDAIIKEVNRALEDHELIKIKTSGGDRDAKNEIKAKILESSDAQLIQAIGHILLIYRAARPESTSRLAKFTTCRQVAPRCSSTTIWPGLVKSSAARRLPAAPVPCGATAHCSRSPTQPTSSRWARG